MKIYRGTDEVFDSADKFDVADIVSKVVGTSAAPTPTSIYLAPPPSNNRTTDTAAVQALSDAAQASGGTVVLAYPGVYKLNITTQKANTNPSFISVAQNTWDGTLRINGNSGQQSRCHLHGIRFGGTVTGAKLTLAGVNNVTWSRLRFTDVGDVGILFYNDNVGEFTELCHGEADFASSIPVAVEYRINHGDPSFHGSGLDAGSTINQSVTETQPKIKIGALCRPYNAPMSPHIWVRNNVPLIDMQGANNSHFHGTLSVESFSASATTVCNGTLGYAGTVSLYDENISLGGLVVGEIVRSDTSLATVVSASDAAKTYTDAAVSTAGASKVDKTTTVNGHALSANVTVTKSDVGLGSVDNTADTAKPVSTAQAAADTAATAAAQATSLQKSSNLSDLANAGTARTNLGLGTAATQASTAFDAAGAAAAAQAASQPLDSDLTALAAIAPSNDDIVQRKSGAWTNRTPAQLKTDLVLVKADVGLGNVDNTSDATKYATTISAIQRSRITPTAAIAETLPRSTPGFGSSGVLVSGRLFMQAIWLEAGQSINSITFISGGTGTTAPTNQWFAIFDASRNKVAITSDNTTTAWPGATARTLNLTATYAVPTSGIYYLGCMVAASTPNNLQGVNCPNVILNLAPIVAGSADTGLTNPASCPSTTAALTAQSAEVYAYVS